MRRQLLGALQQARALVTQLEAVLAESVPEPTDTQDACEKCGSEDLEPIEHAPEELWRKRCNTCQTVWAEPKPEEKPKGKTKRRRR